MPTNRRRDKSKNNRANSLPNNTSPPELHELRYGVDRTIAANKVTEERPNGIDTNALEKKVKESFEATSLATSTPRSDRNTNFPKVLIYRKSSVKDFPHKNRDLRSNSGIPNTGKKRKRWGRTSDRIPSS